MDDVHPTCVSGVQANLGRLMAEAGVGWVQTCTHRRIHFTSLHLGVVHPLQDAAPIIAPPPLPSLLWSIQCYPAPDSSLFLYRIVGLVVKTSASRVADLGFDSRLRRDFSGSIHTSVLKMGTQMATLPGAWRQRVKAGTGWPGVSIL